MAHKNLKLISTRINPSTLDSIEKWRKNHKYWKRNAIINGILTAVMATFSDKEIYDMVRYWPDGDEKPSGSFNLNQKSI